MTEDEIYKQEMDEVNSIDAEKTETYELLILHYFRMEVKYYTLNLSPIDDNERERNLKSIIVRKQVLDEVTNSTIRKELDKKIREISFTMLASKMSFISYLELLTGKKNNEDIAKSKEIDYIVDMYEGYSDNLKESLSLEENIIVGWFQKDLIAYLDELV